MMLICDTIWVNARRSAALKNLSCSVLKAIIVESPSSFVLPITLAVLPETPQTCAAFSEVKLSSELERYSSESNLYRRGEVSPF